MSQIAQQDHLYIDHSFSSGATVKEKEKLVECYKTGTLADVILRDEEQKRYVKVISWWDENDMTLYITGIDPEDGSPITIIIDY